MDFVGHPPSLRSAKGKGPVRSLDTLAPSNNPTTFFDDATPIERANDDSFIGHAARDSHDLSLRLEGNRNSVVDHMLLSLDSMPNGSSSFPVPAPALFTHYIGDIDTQIGISHNLGPGRRRGHTHTESRSSDYDIDAHDIYNTFSGVHRGKRSDEITYLPRQSTRDGSRAGGYEYATSDAARDSYNGNRYGHVRGWGRKGSKGSMTSIDVMGQETSLPMSSRGLGSRAASFDQSQRHLLDQRADASSMMARGRPVPGDYWQHASAPEPHVPAGPRSRPQQAPASTPMHPPLPAYEADVYKPKRKSSIKSATSRLSRKGRPETADISRNSHVQDAWGVPSEPLDPLAAPSPSAGYRKTMTTPAQSNQNQTKERPGFFRRVFGSKSSAPAPQPEHERSQRPPTQARQRNSAPSHPSDFSSDRDRPKTQPSPQSSSQHIAAQMKSQGKVAATPDVPPVPVEHQSQTQTLNKKPSSFFRRRKKSISEREGSRPPITILQQHPKLTNLQAGADVPPAQQSPSISSLRKVMNPYTQGDPHGQEPQAQETQVNSFSPGYTPHKDATIRSVPPGSPLLRKSRPPTAKAQEESFLQDSSGNEERNSGKLSPTSANFGANAAQDTRQRPQTSPAMPFASDGAGKENVSPGLSAAQPGTLRKSPSENSVRGRSPSPRPQSEAHEDDWLVRTANNRSQSRLKTQASRSSNRVWIEDDSDAEKKTTSAAVSPLSLPIEGVRRTSSKASDISPLETISPTSTTDVFQSATSLPIVQVEGDKMTAAESVAIDTEFPQLEDRERAAKIFAGDESFVKKGRAAGWLGETSFVSARTRKAYMELFDWQGSSILNAFRELCTRLVLRAESQQLDRIIDAFSQRWTACNVNHGFRGTDVVHTITYSILMLNTDLHVANQNMSRSEFCRNTLPTIRRIADETSPDGPRLSLETKRPKNRLSILPPGLDSSDTPSDNCDVLVNKPNDGSTKPWESQVETVLREFYNSIRQTPLPLHGALDPQRNLSTASGGNNLTVVNSSTLRRSPSVLSKTPSETISYRGRPSEMRSATSRWPIGNKARSRPRLYPMTTNTVGSSRTSLDDQSVWSPAASSTWSKYSFGKAQTQSSSWVASFGAGSVSVESLGSGFAGEGYSQSIGFANALSQAITREEHVARDGEGEEEFGRVRPLLEDETLELHGAPWAKEGLVVWKHDLAERGKKAKDRQWKECFAVVEKGYLRLFSFHQNSKTQRNKKNRQQATINAGGAVGGGNWLEDAESMGCFLLRQTLASNLPPPGYSDQRPHVWALTFPNGALHFFHVGTDDIGQEFARTANYWSARLSKEPLVGGISNIEYGWSDNILNMALVNKQDSRPGSEGRPGSATALPRARLPGDKATLIDWTPPVQSMMASQLMEVDQMKALTNYVRALEDELLAHNELRKAISLAYSPRHPNMHTAKKNWEGKSSYLLKEIVKYKTYVNSLTEAEALKEKIYAERTE
ncbi:hypothetical protein NA57DRAFT_48817 [Rhizodiscina lignyota]|uniref:SEC7 domain-containing protein n=1 Tax=Rhizodiscina lignyota TaxID=1504668 RepID=A0A9P4I1D1_9PEZI|nr:hypothetical protein NA57DRAFT_48817 [Rhizodiscina lignyota]